MCLSILDPKGVYKFNINVPKWIYLSPEQQQLEILYIDTYMSKNWISRPFFFIINKQKNSTFFYVLRGRNEPTIVTFIVDTLDWQVLQVAPEQFSREKRHNDAFAGSCHWVHSGLFYLQIYTAVYILIFCMSFITSLLGTSETKNCSVVNINKEMKYFLSYRSRYLPSIKLNLF